MLPFNPKIVLGSTLDKGSEILKSIANALLNIMTNKTIGSKNKIPPVSVALTNKTIAFIVSHGLKLNYKEEISYNAAIQINKIKSIPLRLYYINLFYFK